MKRHDPVIALPVCEEKSCDETLCTACALGKFDRKQYRPSKRKATNVLDKVPMDIKGPMEVSAIGGFKYFLVLVDDCSGYITVFLMQAKSQALQQYKTFCEQVWNQLYKRVTYLRCDNANEFLTKQFVTYLNTQGRVLQQTPEVNGTAECNIRTLMKMVRAMLKNAQLIKSLWAEAVLAARTSTLVPRNLPLTNCGKASSLIFPSSESMAARSTNMFPRKSTRCSMIELRNAICWIRYCLYLPIDGQEDPQDHPCKRLQVRRNRTWIVTPGSHCTTTMTTISILSRLNRLLLMLLSLTKTNLHLIQFLILLCEGEKLLRRKITKSRKKMTTKSPSKHTNLKKSLKRSLQSKRLQKSHGVS